MARTRKPKIEVTERGIEVFTNRLDSLCQRTGVTEVDRKSVLEKLIIRAKDDDFEVIFRESISLQDRLEALKTLMQHKQMGDLTEDDERIIEETLFMRSAHVKKIRTESRKNKEDIQVVS